MESQFWGVGWLNIEISARHGHLEPAQQEHIEQKAEKLLRYFGRLMGIEIAVDHQKNNWFAEVLVSAEHKHDFVGRHEGPTAEIAAEMALHKVEEQLRRYKQKIQKHTGDLPQGGTSRTAPDLPEPPDQDSTEGDD